MSMRLDSLGRAGGNWKSWQSWQRQYPEELGELGLLGERKWVDLIETYIEPANQTLTLCRFVIEMYSSSLIRPFRSHARDEPLSSGFQASVSIPSGTSVSFNSYSCPEFCVLYLLHIVVGRDGEVVPRMY